MMMTIPSVPCIVWMRTRCPSKTDNILIFVLNVMQCNGHIDNFENFVLLFCCFFSVYIPSNSVIENNRQAHIGHEEEHPSPVSDDEWNFPEQEYRLSYSSTLRDSLIRWLEHYNLIVDPSTVVLYDHRRPPPLFVGSVLPYLNLFSVICDCFNEMSVVLMHNLQ